VVLPYFPVHDPNVQPEVPQPVPVTLIVTVLQPVWEEDPLLIENSPLEAVPKSSVPVPDVVRLGVTVNVADDEGICNVPKFNCEVCTTEGTAAQGG